MTDPNQPPQPGLPAENEEFAGAELVVRGLVNALEGSPEVIVEETDIGFELTIPEETGPTTE